MSDTFDRITRIYNSHIRPEIATHDFEMAHRFGAIIQAIHNMSHSLGDQPNYDGPLIKAVEECEGYIGGLEDDGK